MAEDYNNNINGQGSAYDQPNKDPKWADRWQPKNIKEYKDAAYDRISKLLLQQFSQIEPFIDGDGIEAIQKTYRDGQLVSGRSSEEMVVVYESDVEANADDEKIENALMYWLEFIDLSQVTLSIVHTDQVNQDGIPDPPNLILKAPDKMDFNLNEIIGVLDLGDVNLKDNVSQFVNLEQKQTDINRLKLSEYVETDFSELSPITFTHHLEKYIKVKNQVPFYRYRTDDFFTEYGESNDVPIEYRVEKFFEEFERIKNQLPKGELVPYNNVEPTLESITTKHLFDWGTLTYLVAESQNVIGTDNPVGWTVTGGTPEQTAYSQLDAITWWEQINSLTVESGSLSAENEALREQLRQLMERMQNMTGSIDISPAYQEELPEGYAEPVFGCTDPAALNYNSSATQNDFSCEYKKVIPPVFTETFNDWQDSYSPSSYWARTRIGNVLKTDGPKGAGDGAVRIYRVVDKGEWPGALYNPSDKIKAANQYPNKLNVPEFDIKDREAIGLALQENRQYEISMWGRCNTEDKKAQFFIGDTRGGWQSGYSWQRSANWNTGNQWTKVSKTFTPKKNKHFGTTAGAKFKVEFWEYDNDVDVPSWDDITTKDAAAREFWSKFQKDWGYNRITGMLDRKVIMKAQGHFEVPGSGTYTFHVKSDDGARLWIDDTKIIDKWVLQGATTHAGTKTLSPGVHKLRLDWFENTGAASLKVWIKGPGIASSNPNGFITLKAHSNPSLPFYPGVFGNIYLYAGTTHGANPGEYCDYANIEIIEKGEAVDGAAAGGTFKLGGPIPSSKYYEGLTPINTLPKSTNDFDMQKMQRGGRVRRTKPKPIKQTKPITPAGGNCNEERNLLTNLTGLNLDEMLVQLNSYLSNNNPCLNISTQQMHAGGGFDETSAHCQSHCGDVNGDGQLNVLDVVQLAGWILGNSTPTTNQLACSDFNGDGLVNVIDIIDMINFMLNGTYQGQPTSVEEVGDCHKEVTTCQGIIGCDGICYPEAFTVELLPISARYGVDGACGSGITDFNQVCQNYGGDCQPLPTGTGNTNVLYFSSETETNTSGELVHITTPATPHPHCKYSWGDGCVSNLGWGEKGGVIGKSIGRTPPNNKVRSTRIKKRRSRR